MGKASFRGVSNFRQMGVIPLLLFTLFWCAITGIFAGFVVRNFYRSYDARYRYAAVDAVVLASEVQSSHDSDGTTYGYGIRYRYAVQGTDYESDRYAFGQSKSSDGHSRAQALTRRHPVGSYLTAYYDPANPAQAVVNRQIDPTMKFLVLFLQPFLLIGIGMLGACIWLPASRVFMRRFTHADVTFPWRVPTWGVLRKEENGRYVLQPRKGAGSVLLALAMGYGLTCFASVFLVGIFGGGFGAPKTSVIEGALVLALVVGVAAAWLTICKGRRKPLLVVDTFNRRVSLEGPGDRVEVRFSDLQAWVVGETDNHSRFRQEGAPAQVPLLSLRSANGQETPVHVFTASEDASLIAARSAEVLAGLTGHPAVSARAAAADTDDRHTAEGSLVQAVLAARKKKEDRATRLRDLS